MRVMVHYEPPWGIVSVVGGERTQCRGPGGWISGDLARPPRSALLVPQCQGGKLHQEHVPRGALMSAQGRESTRPPGRESRKQAWKRHPFASGKCEDRIGQEVHLDPSDLSPCPMSDGESSRPTVFLSTTRGVSGGDLREPTCNVPHPSATQKPRTRETPIMSAIIVSFIDSSITFLSTTRLEHTDFTRHRQRAWTSPVRP